MKNKEMNEVLVYLSKKYHSCNNDIFKALKAKEEAPEDKVKVANASVHSNVVTIADEEYPDYLKDIDNPPIVLYTAGDIAMLNDDHEIGAYISDAGVRVFTRIEPLYDSAGNVSINYCFASEDEALLDRIVNDCKKRQMPLRDYHLDFAKNDKDLINVVVIARGKAPYMTTITNKLECYQSIVSGNIEVVPVSDHTVILCDDEGKLKGKPANRYFKNDVICGTFIIIGTDGKNLRSLTSQEAKDTQMRFSKSITNGLVKGMTKKMS